MRRGPGVLAIFTGLGFGVPGAIGLGHFARTGETWTFLGFPTYGGGPFERVGLDTSVPLLAAFVAVCGAEVVLGARAVADPGRVRAMHALLPVEFAFWIGFALPAGPPLGLARALMSRSAARGGAARRRSDR